MKHRVIYVDIDETICFRNVAENICKRNDYRDSVPIKENIEKINKLYDEGNTIVYWTARGSRTLEDWSEVTRNQLIEWGVKFNELRLDKPYYDLFIDDKNKRIEEI
jgi:hypothetical protein